MSIQRQRQHQTQNTKRRKTKPKTQKTKKKSNTNSMKKNLGELMCSRRVSSSHFLSVTCCATHIVKLCKSLVGYNKQMYITVLYHQKTWVFDWQHICYVCWMCRDSYGYSSRRLVPLFAWSRLHTGAYQKKNERKLSRSFGWIKVLRKGKQFLLHMWHPSYYFCYKLCDKSWMMKRPHCNYDKRNISVDICDRCSIKSWWRP